MHSPFNPSAGFSTLTSTNPLRKPPAIKFFVVSVLEFITYDSLFLLDYDSFITLSQQTPPMLHFLTPLQIPSKHFTRRTEPSTRLPFLRNLLQRINTRQRIHFTSLSQSTPTQLLRRLQQLRCILPRTIKRIPLFPHWLLQPSIHTLSLTFTELNSSRNERNKLTLDSNDLRSELYSANSSPSPSISGNRLSIVSYSFTSNTINTIDTSSPERRNDQSLTQRSISLAYTDFIIASIVESSRQPRAFSRTKRPTLSPTILSVTLFNGDLNITLQPQPTLPTDERRTAVRCTDEYG